jgi:hypothetical protein
VARVVVRSATGQRYSCRGEPDRSGWRCGRCQQGILIAPRLGRRCCLVCEAGVITVRSHRGRVSFVLMVLATLILGWLMLAWWR